MDRKMVAETARRMTGARAILVRDNPFFGRLSLGLQLACAPCGTACTDGERLIFDPEFAKELTTDREMQFVVLHEVLHCVLEHLTRRGSRKADLFNIACDIVVNSTILEMWGIDTIQVAGNEPIHLAPDGREGREYSAEEVYQMLLECEGEDENKKSGRYTVWISTRSSDKTSDQSSDPRETGGSVFGRGCILDNHDIWDAVRDGTRVRDEWNRRIREAVQACHGTAWLPPVVRKAAEELLRRSKVDWRQILHDFLQYDSFDYTFLPPDRRFSDGDFFFPAYNVDEEQGQAKDIWVCVDTSASISAEQLSKAMMEILDAMAQVGLTGSISFFDQEITDPVPFTTENEIKEITPSGGRGTDFRVIFKYLKEKTAPELPRAILVFTDGFVLRWPREEEAMGVPVLWLISEGGNTGAPWGRVAEI